MRLAVIGIGPGDARYLTAEALEALRGSEVVAGYPLYLELIADIIRGKVLLQTPMRRETERCRMALDAASAGRTTALVCSGDAGVYGMAGLVYELAPQYPDVEIVVIPGITAALGGAALLGAPLGHDFAVISLSDLLTPWETIRSRLVSAAQGGFVICLYNPSSKKRRDYAARACRILLDHLREETVCAVVRNAGRVGETVRVTTLARLKDEETDMFTTLFIGNSSTKVINGKMVTPRGYGGYGGA
ncbi:MAG: precorrin-3B C(17)-methyltransferase [Spirochaetaceae bacterium]|jgi:precorrin-3B C17-methyltransferase|nr:precorrin-3B C(17)-methyltransferase [Spirochaetaceae bacterium]